MAGSYLLELSRWNVKNDGTDAPNTSKGINEAIIWATQQGFSEVVLPKGKYLIDENNPIEPQSYMTLNLNGSTLRIRDNGLQGYAIISFERDQVHSRVTNGILQGDRYTHNYTSGGTHEGGYGVRIGDFTPIGGSNVRFITVDNLEILECTGDGITIASVYNQIYFQGGILTLDGRFESGGINLTNGQKTVDNTQIRSTINIDLHNPEIKKYGYVGLYGGSYGGIGSEVITDMYDIIFYKSDGTFISASPKNHFFDEVSVPENADIAKIVLRQSKIPNITGLTLRVPEFPKFVFIEKCHIHHCRRLGIGVTGTKFAFIRGNEIHDIGGTGPAGSIDIEDGYDLNQHVYIEDNHFYKTRTGLIVVAGKNIVISNNKFQHDTMTIWNNADKVLINGNYFYNSPCNLWGEVIFTENHMITSNISVHYNNGINRQANISDCVFLNSSLGLTKNLKYCVTVDNCKFYTDQDSLVNGPVSLLGLSGRGQIIKDCVIEGGHTMSGIGASPLSGEYIFENVIVKNARSTFPAGAYRNCSFIDTGTNMFRNNPEFEYIFEGCRFEWSGNYDFQGVIAENISFKLLRYNNCTFSSTGTAGYALYIWSWGERIELINNFFSFQNRTNVNDRMIFFYGDYWKGKSALIEGNRFSSNIAMYAIDASGLDTNVELLFKDNTVTKAKINLKPNHIKINNYVDGVIDPYYISSGIPTSGYYKLGQEIKNSKPTPGGHLGWVCTTEGNIISSIWQPSTNYSAGSMVSNNGSVYRATVSGQTGTFAPTHKSGSVKDGTVVWEYVSPLAILKAYGKIEP